MGEMTVKRLAVSCIFYYFMLDKIMNKKIKIYREKFIKLNI